MYFLSTSPRKKEVLTSVKPIKRSNYLKNLEKQKYEGLKLIEEEKADILIEKILRRERIHRDYSIFSHHNNDNKINEEEKLRKENVIIKNYNNYNKNIIQKKNKINNSSDFHRNNKELKKISKETFITRNFGRKNILSIIGDDIINSNYLLNNERKRQ